MKKSIRNMTVLVALLACAGWSPTLVNAATPTENPSNYTNSGVQLNRTRQYLERQRVAQEIAADRKEAVIEGTETTSEKPVGAVHFVLKKVDLPKSAVLKSAELDSIVKPYIGKDVTLNDLNAIVEKINDLYRSKGFLTCRAFLSPQTIHAGKVHIDFIEGTNGKVTISGRGTTRENYIRHRVHIEPGKIQDLNKLSDDLRRFNATNDAQLQITLLAGEKPRTTDYVISVKEPQEEVTGVFVDNAGMSTSGHYRAGMYWTDRNLTGNRDHLFFSTLRSDGVKAFSASYDTPINHIGTRAGLTYTSNSAHITDGVFEQLGVKGHASSFTAYITSPIVTSAHRKSEWGIEYGHQVAKTDIGTSINLRRHWADDKIDSLFFYYDQLDFGKSAVFYQKHGYRVGKYSTLYVDDRSFGKYETNMLYQKLFPSGQQWTLRLDGQLSGTDYLPAAELFYIGGLYSVRGYKENLLAGDSGVFARAQFSFPLTKSRKWKGFAFLDGGKVWGDSAYGDQDLAGVGVGVADEINKHTSFNVALGFPLIKTVNGEEQSRARVHFSINSAF